MKCIFLGVSDQSKAYKLYNSKTKKIIISRDVIFDEQNFWAENKSVVAHQEKLMDFDEIQDEQPEISSVQHQSIVQ